MCLCVLRWFRDALLGMTRVSPSGVGGGISGGSAGPARARPRAVTPPSTATRSATSTSTTATPPRTRHRTSRPPVPVGDLGRSPARHGLAPHRLAGRGERGQVRGGLGAVRARRRPRPARAPRPSTRDQGRHGDRRPHGGDAAVAGAAICRIGSGRRGHGRRRPAVLPPLSTAPGSSTAIGPARDVDGQQPQQARPSPRRSPRRRAPRARSGRCGSEACRDRPPAVRLAAGGETDQLAGGVRAAHRRRRGGDRADRQRDDHASGCTARAPPRP